MLLRFRKNIKHPTNFEIHIYHAFELNHFRKVLLKLDDVVDRGVQLRNMNALDKTTSADSKPVDWLRDLWNYGRLFIRGHFLQAFDLVGDCA